MISCTRASGRLRALATRGACSRRVGQRDLRVESGPRSRHRVGRHCDVRREPVQRAVRKCALWNRVGIAHIFAVGGLLVDRVPLCVGDIVAALVGRLHWHAVRIDLRGVGVRLRVDVHAGDVADELRIGGSEVRSATRRARRNRRRHSRAAAGSTAARGCRSCR